MTKATVWNDGRSGMAGCFAGNVALGALELVEASIEKVKGTCFEGAHSVLVGRVCSSDGYLTEPVLHWANTSWDQHQEMKARAKQQGKKLFYVFVTASKDPPVVRYWKVPGSVVETAMTAREKNRAGATCAIHITGDESNHYLGPTKVTEFHDAVTLTGPDAAAMSRAFADANVKASRSESVPRSNVVQSESSTRYAIPVSGGRAVQVELPGGRNPHDQERVPARFALSSDALVSSAPALADSVVDPARSAEQRSWLREQVQAGLDQLARGEGVDGESAFERILAHRRKSHKVAP